MSKRPGRQSEKMKYSVELRAYGEACNLDPEMQNFDDAIQARTGRVIHALDNGGVEVRSLSLDSLREITNCLLEMDQEVVRIILEHKVDIWSNHDLFELVDTYFENSLQTLDFCTVLENCLRKARDNQMIIQNAFQQIQPGVRPSEAQGKKMLEELTNFKNAGSPFSEEFFKHFDLVYGRHMRMLEKLQLLRRKLNRKLKHVRAWKKVSIVIFVATFVAVLICSVVAAAIASPPVAAALAAAVPLGATGKWVKSFWKKYEDAIRSQREAITAMHVGTSVVIKDLRSIKVLVDNLQHFMGSILEDIDLCTKEEAVVRNGIEKIKEKQESFMQKIEDLAQHVDRCSRDIRQARSVIVQRMIKPAR